MDLGIKGKRAIITAASQGLGRAIATELAREGCHVVISSRRMEKLTQVAGEINELIGDDSGGIVYGIRADITNADDISRLVMRAHEILGGIDLLITNAGGPISGDFDQIRDNDWQQAFEMNLLSAVRLIRETLPIMRQQGEGKILNISSLYVREPNVNLILSSAIRTGTMAMLKTLALQVAEENIRIFNVAPGRIETDRVKWLDEQRANREGRSLEDIQEEEKAGIPLKRYGFPEEFGRFVTVLLSTANTYMTGQTILMDGGVIRAL